MMPNWSEETRVRLAGERKKLEEAARAVLVRVPADMPYSTQKLMERLYPVAETRGDAAIKGRKRALNALLSMADRELADCVRRGPPHRNSWGIMARPYLWAAPGTGQPDPDATADKGKQSPMARLERRVQALEVDVETLKLRLDVAEDRAGDVDQAGMESLVARASRKAGMRK